MKKDIEDKGASAFLDKQMDMVSGIDETVVQNVTESRELWVVINSAMVSKNRRGRTVQVTPHTLDRQWVWLEIGAALASKPEVRIVPILIDMTKKDFLDDGETPPFLKNKQVFRYGSDEYKAVLLASLEDRVRNHFVRIRNQLKPDQYIHIEDGNPEIGPIQLSWFSAQWQIEEVRATPFIRLKNRWKPDRYLHIESGTLDAGSIEPGWFSAQWWFEKVPDTPFVRLGNRGKPCQCLHIQNGMLDIGPIDPGWLSAQWSVE